MISPLAKHFSMSELIKYTLPSMAMMLFTSTYSIIDGIFVSSLVGEQALAAVNIVMPLIGVVMAIGVMFASGGNAIIAKFLGQGKRHEANQFLSVIYLIGGILGALLSLIVLVFPDQILNLLNVSDSLYMLAKDYMLSFSAFLMPLFFMTFIQAFMVTAGHPTFGLILSIAGGITNIALDYFLISPNFFDMGIAGAGLATGIGYAVPGIIGLFYFFFNRNSILHFVRPKLDLRTLGESIFNGSSELIASLATSITTLMFNLILINLVGDAGVAAISVILYIQMFQSAIYMGFTIGVAPIIAYKYGAEDHQALHKVIVQSFKVISAASIIVIALTISFSDEAISLFIARESSTFELAKNGLLLFLPAYLFMGFNIFFSAMFTSLSNGKVSAIISAFRSLIFIVIALIVLPQIWGLDGVWLAVPVAEFLAIILGIYFYIRNKNYYQY